MLLTRVRGDRLLENRRMLAVGSPVLMAVAFPRSVFGKDLDLKVGISAALLATAFEELFKVINVLSVAVGEGRQAASVPAHISKLRAATGEAQHVGGEAPPPAPRISSNLRDRESARAHNFAPKILSCPNVLARTHVRRFHRSA